MESRRRRSAVEHDGDGAVTDTDTLEPIRWSAAALVLMLLGVGLVPGASALDSGSWDLVLPGVPDSISRVTSDGAGDKVGFSYKLTTSGTVGFTLFDAGQVSIQTDDISGNGTGLGWTRMAAGGGAVWHVLAEFDATTGYWYRSTDDGVTWTLLGVFTDVLVVESDVDALGNLVVLAAMSTEATPEVRFYKSTTGGIPTGSGYSLSDNRGAPTVVGDNRIPDVNGVSIAIQDASNMAVVFMAGKTGGPRPTIYEVKSTDGGAFWTVPFTTDGGSTGRWLFSVPGSSGTYRICGFPEVISVGTDYYYYWTGSLSGSQTCQPGVWKNPSAPEDPSTFSAGNGAFDSDTSYRHPISMTSDGAAMWTIPSSDSYATWFSTTPEVGSSFEQVRSVSIPAGSTGNHGVNIVSASTMVEGYAVLGYGNRNVGDRLEAEWQETGFVAGAAGLDPVATVAVTGLVGFAIDPAGSTVFARVDGGANVTTHGSENLAESARHDTHCANRFDGVAVSLEGTFVAFIGCGTGGDALALRIRDNQLNDPSNAWSACAQKFGDDPEDRFDAFGSNLPDVQEIHRLEGFDVDLGNCDSSGFNEASYALPFTTFGGKVGVYLQKFDTAGNKKEVVRTVQFDTSAFPQVDQLCAYRSLEDGTHSRTLVATTGNGASRIYQVFLPKATDSIQTTLDLQLKSIGSGSFSGNNGVGCGAGFSGDEDEAILLSKSGSVTFANRNMAATSQPAPADGAMRGVAVSGSGRWAAYKDGDVVHVIDATLAQTTGNFTPRVSLNVPEGTFRAILLDHNAQNAFIATSDVIARYSIFTETTGFQVGNPVQDFNPNAGGSTIDGGGSSSATTQRSAVWQGLMDRFPPEFKLFLSFVVIAGMALGAYRLVGQAPMIVGGAAALGIAMSVAFLDFPIWIPIVIAAPGVGVWSAAIAKRVGGARS